MGQFDIYKWRQKQLLESYNNRLSNQILDQLFEGLVPQNTLLNESKFLKGLKDKIKNTKAFASLVGLASDFKNSSKAITFALRLNALGILPKNEAELQVLKDKLEGKKTKVNEQNEAYSNKLDSELPQGDKDTEELKNFWFDTFAGKAIKTVFVFFMLFQMNAASIVDTVKALSPDSLQTVQTQAGVSDINLAGVSNKLAAAGFDDAQIKDIIAGIGDIKLGDIYNFGGDVKIFVDADGNVEVEVPDDIEDPGELSSETDNINQAADQGLRVNIQGDQTANFSLFDYGSSKLTSEGENEADTEDDKIIDYLLNGQDYSETIVGQSSNTGPNSNFDNSTNESDKLDINRANSLADYVFDDIQKGLDDANAEYTVSGKTITLADGTTYTQNVEAGQNPESLTQIEKTDTTATQSAIRVGEVETTEPPTNVVLVDFDPVADPGTTSGAPFVAPSVSEFGTLIREAQLAVIMALIKPDLSLFPYLNDNKENTPLGGYTQSSFTKIKDNESLPKEIRDLAQAVVNARKKPDSFTSKIANILGVELSQRAKAQQLAPGSAGVGQQAIDFKPIKESLHLFYEMLNEQSAIDQFLDSSNINKNAGQILAYLGSMYASKDNKQIGIVDAEKLPSNIKSQLTKSGFKATSVGRDKGIYVFMDDRTSTPTPDPQPAGVPDDVSQPIPLSIEKDSKIFISSDKSDLEPPRAQSKKIIRHSSIVIPSILYDSNIKPRGSILRFPLKTICKFPKLIIILICYLNSIYSLITSLFNKNA
jgi:hypothetical protein